MRPLKILLILLIILLAIFAGVKIMKTIINGFIAVGDIDIGSEAIERDSSFGAPSTLINKDNPANASGKITCVEIYASLTGDLENCEVATFYRLDPDNYPNKFTTRDTYVIGAVTGGSKQTFDTIDLDVEKGDYLGITFTTGSIELSPTGSGYSGVWYKGGDYIPCSNITFGIYSGATISLKATNAVSSKCTMIDGTLLVNQEGEFFGKTIDGELNVVRNVVGACLDTSQSLRMTITIDGEDVSDSIVGDIVIAHNLNYISTFSLSLGDPKYSPLTDSHIAINSVVVITVFVNGQEIKMFTGLIDSTHTTYDGGYRLNIKGRDYGKKLLDKTMTLISVQESAQKAYRGSIVKYLASQADITNIDVPVGDAVTIDHSFQDQNIWDMIQKECAIEGWYVRHDENAIMHLKTRTIKTDTDDYPKADWDYGEDKFVQLGLETSDRGIINKLIILGAIFEEEIITVNDNEVEPDEETYEISTLSTSKSYSEGQLTIEGWDDGDLSITVQFIGMYLGFTYQKYKFTVNYSGSATIQSYNWNSDAFIFSGGSTNSCIICRESGHIRAWYGQSCRSIFGYNNIKDKDSNWWRSG